MMHMIYAYMTEAIIRWLDGLVAFWPGRCAPRWLHGVVLVAFGDLFLCNFSSQVLDDQGIWLCAFLKILAW